MRLLTVCSFVFVGAALCAFPVLANAQAQAKPELGDPARVQKEADKEKPETPASAKAAINLNSASVDQLEKLPGVGPKMAELIVEYRQKNGGFKKIEDLMNVKGIGEKKFLKLKPLVTVAKTDKAGQ